MKKRLYRKVLKNLIKFFGKLKGHQEKRLKKLAAFICGLMRSKNPSMRAIGQGLLQQIKAHSKEKEVKKFLDNHHWINQQTYYQPYIAEIVKQIIALFPQKKGLTLVIDGSKMGKDHMALMVSLHFQGRGLPLMWLVQQKPKGHFKSAIHLELIEKVHAFLEPIVPSEKSITLLGDGEFDSIDLQEFCVSKDWFYVFRTSSNTILYAENEQFQPKNLEVSENHQILSIPNVEFTAKRLKNVHFVLWHDPKFEKPIPLVSNLEEAIDVVKAYDLRYSIECMFKDMKSTTYNIHKTRLKNTYSIDNLIMLAAFAIILLTKISLKYKNSPLRQYIHRVRRDQKMYSFITYARDFIQYCLEEGYPFKFSFHFSKNSS